MNHGTSRRQFLKGMLGSFGVVAAGRIGFLFPERQYASVYQAKQSESGWQHYVDKDFHFSLDFPTGWGVATDFKQPTLLVDDEAILKRVIFSGYPMLVYLDIWLAKDKSFKEWLTWYRETRLVEQMITDANATVGNVPAVKFLQEHQRNLLITYFSDGDYVYRLLNWMTVNPGDINVYQHMLDTFILPYDNATSVASLSTPMSNETDEQIFEPLVTTCCGYTSSGNPFPCCSNGNCTWWAYRQMAGVPFTGNAGTWWGQVPDHSDWTRHSTNPPTDKRSIAWQSGSPGHVAFIATYSGGATVNITDMGCESWTCVRTVNNKPKSDYNGFIYRVIDWSK